MNCLNCGIEISENSPLNMCQTCLRETLGKKVREIWVQYCLETGNKKPSNIAPWEELSEYDKEVDRKIGEQIFLIGADNEKITLMALLKELTQNLLLVIFDLTDSEKISDKASWFHHYDRWNELLQEISVMFSKYNLLEFFEDTYKEVAEE